MGINKSKVPQIQWPCSTEENQWEALKDSRQLKEYKEYRDKYRNHKYSPRYHFYAPDGKINDPNGFTYWNGNYHLFYQQYPPADPRQHWGHAISKDLVRWKDLPTAIFPDPEKCVFSGNAIFEDDRVLAMYFGTESGIFVAESKDPLLLNWEKLTGDAVIKISEDAPYKIYDPHIRKEADGYYALSGVYRYTPYGRRMCQEQFYSEDLINWKYIGELMDECPYLSTDDDGACPYFIQMKDDQYCLFLFSHGTGPHIFSGTYDNKIHKFTPHHHIRLSSEGPMAGSLNAPCVTKGIDGNVYVIYNATEGIWPSNEYPRWGCMTLMYTVRLGDNNEPIIEPAPQIDTLREELLYQGGFKVEAGKEFEVPASGKALEIELNVKMNGASSFTLDVFRSDREKTSVKFNQRNELWREITYVTIDTTDSSFEPLKFGRMPETIRFDSWDHTEDVKLRVFIDHCTVEVFYNGKVIFAMAHPSLPESNQIYLKAGGYDIEVTDMKVWKMEEIM